MLLVAIAGAILLRRCRGLCLFLLGYLAFMAAGKLIVEDRLQQDFEGDSMLAEVRVVDFPRLSGETLTMLVAPVADPRLPPRSRVSWFDPISVPKPGEIWALELRLRQPRGNSNPGGFRLEDWMFRDRIYASGYVVSGKRNRRLGFHPIDSSWQIRQSFVDFAAAHGGNAAPVIAAIGVGARHLLAAEDWERFAMSGTSHLMAISGLHIGLAATATLFFVTALSGTLRLPGNHLAHGMLCATAVASVYASVSGFAVPSQRATLMLALFALTCILRRRPNPLLVVAQASIVIYLFDPVAVMKPGFGLSFVAVIVLLWRVTTDHRLAAQPGVLSGASTAVRSLAAVQLALLIGLLPLTMLIFQRIAIAAPAVNMIAVPIFSLVTVPSTLLSLVVHTSYPAAAALLLQPAVASVLIIDRLIVFVAAFPTLNVELATSRVNWLLLACTSLWLMLPRAWPGRWIGLLAVLWIVCFRPATPPSSCVDAHVLDIGQGLAVVVQSESRTLIYDTGPSFRGGSAASRILLPFLRQRGIKDVDWLVVSHADNDHAGGVDVLQQELKVGQVYVGESRGLLERQQNLCEAGQRWSGDGIDYEFLYPAGERRRSGNNASCVLSVSVGQYRLLLTGDIEAEAERDLLADSRLQVAEVVVVPHHGSMTSSTPAFVARTRPQIAISSAAYGNRWGLPREAAIKRWRDAGARVLGTANSGAISLRLCAGDGLRELRRNRLAEYRFWHPSVPHE